MKNTKIAASEVVFKKDHFIPSFTSKFKFRYYRVDPKIINISS